MTITLERTKSGALKLGLAAAAAVALTFTGLSPAAAANSQIGPGDVIGFEDGAEGTPGYNYDQWHIGNTTNPESTVEQSLQFGACGVTFLPPVIDVSENPDVTPPSVTQLLKGFPIDGRPTANTTNGTASAQALIDSISIDVAQGNVTLQIPVFQYWNGDLDDRTFTTFRNTAEFGPGVHKLAGIDLTESANGATGLDFGGILNNWQMDITDYGDIFEILGVGMTGSDGAIVNSISFGGNTYFFGTGDCVPAGPGDPGTPPTPTKPKAPVGVETGL